jgi:hypothetical protein
MIVAARLVPAPWRSARGVLVFDQELRDLLVEVGDPRVEIGDVSGELADATYTSAVLR